MALLLAAMGIFGVLTRALAVDPAEVLRNG